MENIDAQDRLQVTFHPPLYLQRQQWLLDTLQRENIRSVLDIGCGDGALIQCLTEPSITLPPTTSLPDTSPFVSNSEDQADLYLRVIHGLDPCVSSLVLASLSTEPPSPDKKPFTGFERWNSRPARWIPLEVNLWEGGFETINEAFEGDLIDAFVASEVIEHLTPEIFPFFVPVLLGHYRPRLILLTTPNFSYNQRFVQPGGIPTGYLDPTRRTDRVFRHHDHKFEWTTEEWTEYCTESATKFGYLVEIGGIGRAVEPDPWNREANLGYASQVALFRRLDGIQPQKGSLDVIRNCCAPVGQAKLHARHIHHPHPLSLEDLALPPSEDEIREAVKEAMVYNRMATLTFGELWKHGNLSLKCRGDIGALVRAFEAARLNADVWLVEDEPAAWDMKVTWKNFVNNEVSLEPPEPEAYKWSDEDSETEEDVEVEEDAADDLHRSDWPQPGNDDLELQEKGSPRCTWGWGESETHSGWDNTNARACDGPNESPWSGSFAHA